MGIRAGCINDATCWTSEGGQARSLIFIIKDLAVRTSCCGQGEDPEPRIRGKASLHQRCKLAGGRQERVSFLDFSRGRSFLPEKNLKTTTVPGALLLAYIFSVRSIFWARIGVFFLFFFLS